MHVISPDFMHCLLLALMAIANELFRIAFLLKTTIYAARVVENSFQRSHFCNQHQKLYLET